MMKLTTAIAICIVLLSCGSNQSKHLCNEEQTSIIEQVDTIKMTTREGGMEDFGEMHGEIRDENQETIPFAKIKLSGSNSLGALTDIDGRFKIQQIPPGVYSIEISVMGYEVKIIEGISIEPERILTFNATILIIGERIELLKPIIYLYPEEKTAINVKLIYDGKITTTYPLYNSGWDIIATPDGNLVDGNGRSYYALYWEGNPITQLAIPNGSVVSRENSISFLEESLATLGLNEHEANEFIMFWLPHLEKSRYNLIHFAGSNYTESAELIISPKPETTIRVMMVFQPLDSSIDFPSQNISMLAKQRKGYTVVEWGGQLVSPLSM